MSLNSTGDKYGDLRVLVVDDEPLIIELVEAVVRELGIPVVYKAHDGKEALGYFAGGVKNKVDLLICDWMMPEMDGLELLRRLRAVRQEIPILMLTRRRSRNDITTVKDFGVSDTLTKPFTPAQLRKKVERLATVLVERR